VGEVVELLAAYVRERGAPARYFEASRPQEQLVQASHGSVMLGSHGAQCVQPRTRVSAGVDRRALHGARWHT
jgi:hypothetical protein